MTAQELRIGNFFITPEGVQEQVYSIALTFGKPKYYLVNGWDERNIKPIPLSPEWLEKFGFGKSEDHEMGHNVTEPWGFYFDYHFKRFRLENYADDGGFDQTMKHIQYVHQLQNLYFALTGSELLIKQEKDEIN